MARRPPPPSLARFRLVLASPRTPGNVGACARVAANFDLADIVIAAPVCDWQGWDARKFATGDSARYLEGIRRARDVREAVADCQIAIGFSRRLGRARGADIRLGEIAELGERRARVALVFGNEETGLSTAELAACTHLCSFETAAVMPSMNLSHAVALAVGSVFEAESSSRSGERARGAGPARLRELEALLAHWRELLIDAGMNRAGNPERILFGLRKIFDRAALTAREIRLLRGVLSKTQVRLGTRARGRRVS
jgi:TrmH family RNA methyltransferase